MTRLVPVNNVVALTIAPSVWLGYFVVTFLISALGCERGWHDVQWAGVNVLLAAQWLVALIALALIALATWESWQHGKIAQDPRENIEAEERERRTFLSKAGLFLCGISLLGTLWGALNMLYLAGCAR